VTLPPDLIMPVVATLFLGFAAVMAMFGRRNRGLDSGRVTYAPPKGQSGMTIRRKVIPF
jgi:hypothetical protein